jgi:hypothetical protein
VGCIANIALKKGGLTTDHVSAENSGRGIGLPSTVKLLNLPAPRGILSKHNFQSLDRRWLRR